MRPFSCADAVRGRLAAPASAAAPSRTSRRDFDRVMVEPPGVGELAEILRLKYAACRFAPADMDLFSDHRQRLFRPVLDLHDDSFCWRQADVQIDLRTQIGDEFHSAWKAVVH